jgi:hypothetical protein
MRILPCTKEHTPAVVELLTGQPAHGDPIEHAALCEYFQEVYFGNPWYDPELPSLVCEDASGSIAGFQGVMPRPMVLATGEQVRAVALSNLRVPGESPKPANPFAAIQLMKKCLEGPQDLTVANGSNWRSKKIWETCGGITAPLYSFDWFRPIRPARALLEFMELGSGRSIQPALRPLADAADVIGTKLFKRHTGGGCAPYRIAELDTQHVVEALALAPGFDIRPLYDVASFSWLLEMSRHSAVGGWVRAAMLRDDRDQREVGWFIYFQQRERVGRVVQLFALHGHLDSVLRAVIEDAASRGVALLRGEVDPTDLQPYRDTACLLNTGRWTLIHARRPSLLEGFLGGKALFTGLDGERWLRPFRPSGLRRLGAR